MRAASSRESLGVGGFGGQSMCVDACGAYEKQTSKEAKLITKIHTERYGNVACVWVCVCVCSTISAWMKNHTTIASIGYFEFVFVLFFFLFLLYSLIESVYIAPRRAIKGRVESFFRKLCNALLREARLFINKVTIFNNISNESLWY